MSKWFDRHSRKLEWFLLLFGLAAIDTYVWVNTTAVVYQAYQDWSFDQTLRGLTPEVSGFVVDEITWLFRGHPIDGELPDVTPRFEPPARLKQPGRSVLGRLRIPRLRIAAMVREGADEGTLRLAVGHIPGTALPGRSGNVGLAGHRDTFFRALREIRTGDAIAFQTESGAYRYVVDSTKIVGPRDVSVLAASKGETLTLVTCFPFYYVGSAPKRFIVRASQVEPRPQHQSHSGS